jgi:hypothetical protein
MDPRRRRTRLLVQGYAHAVQPLSAFAPQPVPPIQQGGQPHVSFASAKNPHYKSMLAIIRRGQQQVLATPRIDMPGAIATSGECRMFIAPSVPKQAPQIQARTLQQGGVRLEWKRSANLIGLRAEIHRSNKKDYTPSDKTLLAETLLAHHVDVNAPVGEQHYALILKSGDQRSEPMRTTINVPPLRSTGSATKNHVEN